MKVGINTTPLHSGHRLRGIGYYTRNLLTYLKEKRNVEISEFERLSEVKDVELVHYPWFDFYFHTLPIAKSFPTVVTIHDVIPLIFPKQYPVGLRGKINFYLQKRALKNCKFIITDSLVSKADIIRHLKVDAGKIIPISLAADPGFKVLKDTELLLIKRKYNLPERFLMYTGDANWIKNLPFLIDCFSQLIKIPEFREIKLVLVGGVFLKNVENINHPELESLKQLSRKIKEYQLEDKVIRPGNIENSELVAFYNLATVYIQPSLYEGFGLPLLQSFACGTPVVSSDRGSLPEVGGKAAIYFNPIDLKQTLSILGDVLQDRSLQYKLSKLGFEQASKFSWEKCADQTAEVYQRVINVK